MLNLCVFVFMIYAVGYSARVILLGEKAQKRRKVSCTGYRAKAQRSSFSRKLDVRPSRKGNIIKLKQPQKSGRLDYSKRLVIFYTDFLSEIKLCKN